MASTPPPQQDNSNDWRASVVQSYRNAEVRDIARVLASFEPGASESSKLMLAMRFEDAIFKAAGSLADYRKRIAKRLKKVQTSYAKNEAVPHDSAAAATNATEELIKTLRTNYGDAIRYIVKHAETAVRDVEAKAGTDRSHQLKQHTDSAVLWAKQLGIYEGGADVPVPPLSASEAAAHVSEAQLQMLQQHLERRVENIRLYVVKHVDPDLFMFESIEKKERELKERANRLLSICLVKLVGRLQDKGNSSSSTGMTTPTTTATHVQDGTQASATTISVFDAHKALQEALERAQARVPAPTRRSNSSANNNNIKNHDVSAALVQTEKMRAASSALVAYFGIPDRQLTAPRNSLQKIMTVVKEGAAFVTNVIEQLPERSINRLTLSDAWNKVLELPLDAPPLVIVAGGGDTEEGSPPFKRLKVDDTGPSSTTTLNNLRNTPRLRNYTTARVLLTPHRKTPSNLIPALRRKRVQLIRPPHGSRGSHLILEFDNIFTMTIYLSPLVVTLRAMSPPNVSDKETTKTTVDRPLATTTQLSTKGCASWTPLYHGLTNRQDLSVWGVNDASYESVGRIVEERLRDASMQATQLLRRCFGNHVKDKTVEFEVELLEASALLEFLHVARTTYMPNLQDDDGDVQ